MRRQYDQQLEELHASLIRMGEMISEAIGNAIGALISRDDEQARRVIAYDAEIDRQEKLVEQLCLKLLLCQQPVAADLRAVSAALKVITDMERIGDHAADISEIELMLSGLPAASDERLRGMAARTRAMLAKSLEAFVTRNEQMAREAIDEDDGVDRLFDEIRRELVEMIRRDPDSGETATDILMAAKYFERIGDHATNIAEWAIFAKTGSRTTV